MVITGAVVSGVVAVAVAEFIVRPSRAKATTLYVSTVPAGATMSEYAVALANTVASVTKPAPASRSTR